MTEVEPQIPLAELSSEEYPRPNWSSTRIVLSQSPVAPVRKTVDLGKPGADLTSGRKTERPGNRSTMLSLRTEAGILPSVRLRKESVRLSMEMEFERRSRGARRQKRASLERRDPSHRRIDRASSERFHGVPAERSEHAREIPRSFHLCWPRFLSSLERNTTHQGLIYSADGRMTA